MTTRKYRATLVLTSATALAAACFYFACHNPVTSGDLYKPPRSLGVTFDGTAVLLSWKASERGAETGYEVWRSVNGSRNYEKIITLAKGTETYRDSAVKGMKLYYYKLRGVYGGEPGEFSNEVSIRTFLYLWSADGHDDKVYKISYETGESLGAFESPGSFPMGLTWTGNLNELWLVKGVSESYICRVNITNGSVISSFDAPCTYPWGLANDGSKLWLTNASDSGNLIYCINPGNGEVIRSFTAPNYAPKGLTWDGKNLWNVAFDGNDICWKIYKLDAATGSVLTSFNAPGIHSSGLTWDGNYLWNADDVDNEIYKINAETGSVMASFGSQGGYPTGLTVPK